MNSDHDFDPNLVYEDGGDEGPWSPLTEDATVTSPFSPVSFRDSRPAYNSSLYSSHNEREKNTLNPHGSEAARAMQLAIEANYPPPIPPPPVPPPPPPSSDDESSEYHQENDAVLLAQSRQHQNKAYARAVRVPLESQENKDFYRPHGAKSSNHYRYPDDDTVDSDAKMDYLPSHHFQLSAAAKASALQSSLYGSGSIRSRKSSSSSSGQNQVRLYASQPQQPTLVTSPSNESQQSTSSFATHRSMRSHRSAAASQRSSTSLSILHGEVINLEGNVAMAEAAASRRRLQAQQQESNQRFDQGGVSNLSGMEIGGSSPFRSEGRPSGGNSLISSQGFHPLQEDQYAGNTGAFHFGLASEQMRQHANKLKKDAKKGAIKIKGHAASVAQQIMSKYYRPPLSPRSKELKDLEYLQKSHKEKFGQLKVPSGNVTDGESFRSNMDGEVDENFFDFVLVLSPQEAYEYWANLLDFTEEYGVDISDLRSEEVVSPGGASTNTTDSRASNDEAGAEDSKADVEFNRISLSPESNETSPEDLSTPLTGLLRRRSARTPNLHRTPTRRLNRSMSRNFDSHQKSRLSQFSQTNLLSPLAGTPFRKGLSRMSMFEKAIHSPSASARSRTYSHTSYYSGSIHTHSERTSTRTITETPARGLERNSVSTVRRRWGNPSVPSKLQSATSFANVLSPPVRSRGYGSEGNQVNLASSVRSQSVSNQQKESAHKTNLKIDVTTENTKDTNENPNSIESEYDIPNPVIPRGIAARTNGMANFLKALQRGIVLRRHRPDKEAILCRVFSNDRGDTIRYELIDYEEAMLAFKEQRVRYNRNLKHDSSPRSIRENCTDWSCMGAPPVEDPAQKFIPDHIKAQKYREKLREHGVCKKIYDVAVKAANSGFVRASDIVAVHPASQEDRRNPGFLGTSSLRASQSRHESKLSFSLVISANSRFRKSGSDNLADKWRKGEGSEQLFKTLDFEAATEGEYWLIFRGLLLLHRDAVCGRFAVARNAGIAGGNRINTLDNSDESKNPLAEDRLQQDMYVEPATVGRLEKLAVKLAKANDDYIRGVVVPGAVPPPSDYFLGFKSPGTQIWSRLRLAGFETQRVYSIDPKKVMIKIRCPEDRLTDVAEVLRLKMKTKEGSFAPFREDEAHLFERHDDHLDVPSTYRGRMASLLRSKDRQRIINFIIGSRIRDSGAELAQTSDVGKMIEARIPLHMPRKLESLFKGWVLFWREENWTGNTLSVSPMSISGKKRKSMEEGESDKNDEGSEDGRPIPNFVTRFFIEAFNQPLDAIEDYFGEQVTFYFAWMQHCSMHLLFLALLGLIVTCFQISSNNFVDHPIRPWYSLAVMMWTFVVLINWRKRSNALAYRWGSMDHKGQETNRPEFYGDYVQDPITEEWVIKYPRWKRWLKYLISIPISAFFTGLALFLILIVHANRDTQMANFANNNTTEVDFTFSVSNIGKKQYVETDLSKEVLWEPQFWFIMVTLPCLLGLCIPILNIILMNVSVMLNNFENYRTDAEYRTHLIMKVFSFRFVSQFGTVYYYAFLSIDSEDPQRAIQNGMIRMATSLVIYTTIAHYWNIILQVYVFMGIRNIRRHLYQKRLRRELKRIELEEEDHNTNERCDAEDREIALINKRILLDQAQDPHWMEIMNPPHDSFPEYITAVMQFTFVACFSVILPCVPFLVLLNYLLSMRFDAFKVCKGRRRPFAKRTGGIGVWEHLLHIVAVIAVLTNVWLVAITDVRFRKMAENIGPTASIFIVVAWEHVMLLIKYLMGTTISKFPKEIRKQMKEKDHEIEKKRYENFRLKTEQTRRMKRDKSISSFRLLSGTPDSVSRSGSTFLQQDSKLGMEGHSPSFHPHYATPDDSSRILRGSTGTFSQEESRALITSKSVPRFRTSASSERLQTIDSFDESVDDLPDSQPGELFEC